MFYLNFVEFMPNYQEMMNTSMGAMGSGGRGQSSMASSFTNFTSVNVMLKGFMELQKEQLKVEKAKAEAEAKGIYCTSRLLLQSIMISKLNFS